MSFAYNINDANNSVIRSVNASGTIETLSAWTSLQSPIPFLFTSSDTVFTANDGFSFLLQAVVAPNGAVYVNDYDVNTIYQISPGYGVTRVAGNGAPGYPSAFGASATAQALYDADGFGFCADSQGNIYVAVSGFSYAGGSFVACVNMQATTQVIFGVSIPAGAIAIVAGGNGMGYSGDGGPAISAALYNPRALAIDPSGNLWICDYNNYVIRQVDPSGTINTLIGDGSGDISGDGGLAINAGIGHPGAIITDAAGNIYFWNSGEFTNFPRIMAVNMQATTQILLGVSIAAGHIAPVFGNGTIGFSGSGGPAVDVEWGSIPNNVFLNLFFDPSGNLYIPDGGSPPLSTNAAIWQVNSSGTATVIAGGSTSGYSGDGGPATSAQLYLPLSVFPPIAPPATVGAITILTPGMATDYGGAAIRETYALSPFPDAATELQLQLSPVRKVYPYATALLEGAGEVTVTAWPENLNSPAQYAQTQAPFTVPATALDDTNIPLNVTGNRMFLVFAAFQPGSVFNLVRVGFAASKDPRLGVRGY